MALCGGNSPRPWRSALSAANTLTSLANRHFWLWLQGNLDVRSHPRYCELSECDGRSGRGRAHDGSGQVNNNKKEEVEEVEEKEEKEEGRRVEGVVTGSL